MPAKFRTGKIVLTPGAIDAICEAYDTEAFQRPAIALVQRHERGDWGSVTDHDRKANEEALKLNERILSVYSLPKTNERLYVITERDRSATTLLLPSEY